MVQLSFSAASKYLECPKSYYFHYIRKLRPIQEKSALIFGSFVDNSMNLLLEGKPLSEALDHYTQTWAKVKYNKINYSKADLDYSVIESTPEYEELVNLSSKKIENIKGYIFVLQEKQKNGELTDFEENYLKKASYFSLKNKGLKMIEAYNEMVIPHLDEVIEVQKRLNVKNPEGDSFVGCMDLLAKIKVDKAAKHSFEAFNKYDGETVMFDNKTSSVTYKDDSVRTSKQLATYHEMAKKDYDFSDSGFIVIPKNLRKKKEPKVNIQVLIDRIEDDFIQETISEYGTVYEGIKDGEFPRNKESCISKFGKCPYYDLCHNGTTEGLKCVKSSKESR